MNEHGPAFLEILKKLENEKPGAESIVSWSDVCLTVFSRFDLFRIKLKNLNSKKRKKTLVLKMAFGRREVLSIAPENHQK